jgi:hypothetical protein
MVTDNAVVLRTTGRLVRGAAQLQHVQTILVDLKGKDKTSSILLANSRKHSRKIDLLRSQI